MYNQETKGVQVRETNFVAMKKKITYQETKGVKVTEITNGCHLNESRYSPVYDHTPKQLHRLRIMTTPQLRPP